MEIFLERRIGNRILDHYELLLAQIDTTNNGPQAKVFRESFELVEQEYGTQIEKWLGNNWEKIFNLGKKAEGVAAIATWAIKIRDKVFQTGIHGDVAAVLEEAKIRGDQLQRLRERLATVDPN